jgi:hypothetical protein
MVLKFNSKLCLSKISAYFELVEEATEAVEATELTDETAELIDEPEAPIVESEVPIVESTELISETTEDAADEITKEASDEDLGAVQPANPIAARMITAKIARNFFMVLVLSVCKK